MGLAVDQFGTLYFADETDALLRKVDTNGTIWTAAGVLQVCPVNVRGSSVKVEQVQPLVAAVCILLRLQLSGYATSR